MSNERFKFRVWSKKSNRYVNRYVIDDEGVAYQCNDAGEFDYELIPNADVIIEQCTGLKDKNGKLIFEGDVLQAPGQTIAYKVQWAHHGFVVKVGFSSAKSYPMSNCEMFEIIGNIHEMELEK